MEYNNLLELIQKVSESDISSFQYEDGATRICITSGINAVTPVFEGKGPAVKQEDIQADVKAAKVEDIVEVEKPIVGNIVKSPLVGTFYATPAEGAQPFVQLGDVVKKGQTLAIVEAMKLMNDIEAEFEGRILEVFVANGDSVEYGQPLFAIG